ncbi:glycosyltransferase [Actinomyces weissii]|uniref:Glucosyl-3-phosphoglycerate synthase n=1 Tax=Actinomyces weissii TaxID=675090 RepID=A0A7T7M9K0_9ACTO|nr:glycosyltransferase [Actinomyces weissii]QQM67270.1 glycosyltransferase [Actinomyces weissii]
MSADKSSQAVAVVIPAKDEADRIAATVRACRAIPRVDLVVVVDDGSTDATGEHARAAGAVVVRHSVTRGKASALETGAGVVAMRDPEDSPKRLLLFLDADLGDSAAAGADLVPPVSDGVADMSVAVLPKQAGAGGRGRVVRAARAAIAAATGWTPLAPLSGQRCLTREAYNAAQPFAEGWGVEVGMTIDVLVSRHTVIEVPCDIHHRATGNDTAGRLHRANQYKDVMLAVMARKVARSRVPRSVVLKSARSQQHFTPYNAWDPKVADAAAESLRGPAAGAHAPGVAKD